MFTGITQGMAQVTWVKASPTLTHYAIEIPPSLIEGLKIGASLAVAGICQTVVSIEGNVVAFDAIEETLKRTHLKQLKVGQWLNVERSAKMGDEIGGHVLSGHIMGTATISKLKAPTPNQKIVTFQCDPTWIKYILPKGYIALNGSSLTVVDVYPEGKFTVHLIPETLRVSTFGKAFEGELVNVELDHQTKIIVDTIERVSLLPQL